MSKIGHTYGSEWHLLRYLGYHRDALDRAVQEAIPGSAVQSWLDWGFEQRLAAVDKEPPRFLDREFEGIDFLPRPEQDRLRVPLADFWPCTGSLPNWDAIAQVTINRQTSWLIVEAKSHLGELNSVCKAKGQGVGGGRDKIVRAFNQTQAQLGIVVGPEAWLGPYYQFCNRLAFLHFLTTHGVPARLLFLYFLGDRFPPTHAALCPGTEDGWAEALRQMAQHTGWSPDNLLAGRVHRAFLPVCASADP